MTRLNRFRQEVRLRARGILRAELDVVAKCPGELHTRNRLLDDLVLGLFSLN
jgi:hypothetical protein